MAYAISSGASWVLFRTPICLVMTILYWSASCPLTNPGVTLGILINTGFGGFSSLAALPF
jgi:hypothetical protein